MYRQGRPVLLVTTSLEESKRLQKFLVNSNLPARLVNAQTSSSDEERIVKRAGRKNPVTVGTNILGRGTDIKLGGNLQAWLDDFLLNLDSSYSEHYNEWTALNMLSEFKRLFEPLPLKWLESICSYNYYIVSDWYNESLTIKTQGQVLIIPLRVEYQKLLKQLIKVSTEFDKILPSSNLQVSSLLHLICMDRLLRLKLKLFYIVIKLMSNKQINDYIAFLLNKRWDNNESYVRLFLLFMLFSFFSENPTRVKKVQFDPQILPVPLRLSLDEFVLLLFIPREFLHCNLTEDLERSFLFFFYMIIILTIVRNRIRNEQRLIKNLGGLHVIGVESSTSRRIDLQLRGRAARQGQPGSSQFIAALDDSLFQAYNGVLTQPLKKLVNKVKNDSIRIIKSVKNIQEVAEGFARAERQEDASYEVFIDECRASFVGRRKSLVLNEGSYSSDSIRDIDKRWRFFINRTSYLKDLARI